MGLTNLVVDAWVCSMLLVQIAEHCYHKQTTANLSAHCIAHSHMAAQLHLSTLHLLYSKAKLYKQQ